MSLYPVARLLIAWTILAGWLVPALAPAQQPFSPLPAAPAAPFTPGPIAPGAQAPGVPAPGVPAPGVPALAPETDPVVVGRMEHNGWSLVGARCRHYIFGGLAVADYVWRGERRIVTMQEETDLPKDDPNYLYYRELRTGNRWAFRKQPASDRTYSVWYKPFEQRDGKWLRLERARLVWPAGAVPTPLSPASSPAAPAAVPGGAGPAIRPIDRDR